MPQCQVRPELLVLPAAPVTPNSPDPVEYVSQVNEGGYQCAIIYRKLNSLIEAVNARRPNPVE